MYKGKPICQQIYKINVHKDHLDNPINGIVLWQGGKERSFILIVYITVYSLN